MSFHLSYPSFEGLRDSNESKVPITPRKTSPGSSSRPSPLTKASRLNAAAPAFIPSSPGLTYSFPPTPTLSEGVTGTATPLSDESDHESSDDDLTKAYVKVKSQIDDLTTDRRSTETRDAAFLQNLQRRLNEIRQDYLFDAKDAEEAYQQQRQIRQAQRIEARLRGLELSHPVQKPEIVKSPDPAPTTPTEPGTPRQDIFDDHSDGEGGGLFDLLQEMPSTEVSDQGTTITIRDFPLPKHWSGRTPRLLLQDTTRKLDRYAIIEFQSISASSRAKRAAVRIVWQRYRDGFSEWSMDDVACHTDTQAEEYIATVALHSLTFPSTPGFAIGATAATTTATSFRLLPSVFRDLWSELEERRKANDDAANRAIWKKLMTILDAKVAEGKVSRAYSSFIVCDSMEI